MKNVFFLVAFLIFSMTAPAQVLKRLGDRAKSKMEQKAGDQVDKKIDEAVDGPKKVKTDEDGDVKIKEEDGSKIKTEGSKSNETSWYSSKYDFVPGDKILYSEDFSQDVIGEFPLKWNTNGNGELVTLEGVPGKWLNFQEATKYESAFKGTLPENYTIEFDFLCDFKDDQSVPWIYVMLKSDILPGHATPGHYAFILMPNHGNSSTRDAVGFQSTDKSGGSFLNATDKMNSQFSQWNHKKKPIHVAIWVQKQRVRAWLNQEKMYDLPKGILADVPTTSLGFEVSNYGGPAENFHYFISNLKIAVANPDTRSKLVTEGKWSTTGILFDVNSDKIKPESAGVLKSIAGTLSENPDLKVKIIGHTDSDGDDKSNLDLSKRRALAVKNILSTQFNIDASRMETDGKGESVPVDKNSTPEGKANNRRVEFIKL